LVNDVDDWYKYFKCSEIDPTCLPGPVINRERSAGLRRLFRYKVTHYPLQTWRLLRRFTRYMKLRDVVYLIVKPFLGSGAGPTKSEVLSRAVEHSEIKDAAADLTHVADEALMRVMHAARAERLRIERDAEAP
jgi:anaerobic magnesium-protoporphyrin IX monomethyl ester cyclase